MTRMTRARAAEVAETLHVDEDAVLDIPDEKIDHLKPATPPRERSRSPLGELAPNSAESKESDAAEKRAKGKKGGKKGSKGKKKDLGASTATQPEESEDAEREDGTQGEGGVEIDGETAGAETEQPDASQEDMSQTSPQDEIVPSQENAAEHTSAQQTEAIASPKRSTKDLPNIQVHEDRSGEANSQETQDELDQTPASPIATATPRVINSLRRDTPGKRSTSNKENVQPTESPAPGTPSMMRVEEHPVTPSYDELEAAVVHGATPPSVATRQEPSAPAENNSAADAAAPPSALETATPSASSRRASSSKAGDAIEALDELEDAVENVKQAIPNVRSLSETRRASRIAQEKDKPTKTKSAPVVKMTKAAQARLSMAQGIKPDAGKASSSARPRPSTTVARSSSVRQSTAPAPGLGRSSSVRQSTAPAAASKRVTSTSSTKAGKEDTDEPREKKEAVIPHSKSRPISMSFPTPPPPPKSTKAPTKSSFQLPGEAVAAKLKAAREARAAADAAKAETKEKDGDKKPAFKARPAPSSLNKVPSVRQTAASRARESTINGTTAAPKPSSASGLKRANTIATSKPRPSTLSSTANTTSSRTAALAVPRSRPSTTASTTSAAPAKPTSSSGPTGRSVSAGTAKGKEVFSRHAAAKAAAEQEKREKEDAAKKARVQAAERSRQASREWAEKQRKKAAAAKAVEGGEKEVEAVVA